MTLPHPRELKDFLDRKVEEFNRPSFIEDDPICIPHLFSKKQDIELMGFWVSILAWGQRKTIISKCKELIQYMDGAPIDFVRHHQEKDLIPFLSFKHRTFNDLDTLYFLSFFKRFYQEFDSLEDAFLPVGITEEPNVGKAIVHFNKIFFSMPDVPHRTRKHISNPIKKSACKRINMFLRWMVRKDQKGVDFGLWTRISPAQLVCPCDVHVDRIARRYGLLARSATDWEAAIELTNNLKCFDPYDPVKYDFALFGLGIEAKRLT